ncbi:unnamed protein product, partial [Darwinula stevensoni]
QQGKKNQEDEGSEFPVSNLPEELESNELVDAAVDVLRTLIYERIDHTIPLKTFQWPIMEGMMNVSFMDLHLPFGVTVRLTQCILFGLENAARNGEARVWKEGRTFVGVVPAVLGFGQLNCTLELQALFLNFREKIFIELSDLFIVLKV